jgi:hypothetical protein
MDAHTSNIPVLWVRGLLEGYAESMRARVPVRLRPMVRPREGYIEREQLKLVESIHNSNFDCESFSIDSQYGTSTH